MCVTQDPETLFEYSLARGLKVYEHNVERNESTQLMTAKEIVNVSGINSDAKSPEGYTFEPNGYYRSGGGDIFFDFSGGGSRYESGPFLVRKNKRIPLNLRPSTQQSIHFLGWAR
jgi:hypothetical protein